MATINPTGDFPLTCSCRCGNLVEITSPKPYKCPVCEGSGKQYTSQASTNTVSDNCHACFGNGIVWG